VSSQLILPITPDVVSSQLILPITPDIVSSNLDKGEAYNIMWWSLSVTCDRSVAFSTGRPFFNTNNTDRHDITEILLKLVLNKQSILTK
jgi:hypothetical protein